MEKDRRPQNPEKRQDKNVIYVRPVVAEVLRAIALPQRSDGCGPMAGFYRNTPDEDLPWKVHHLDTLFGISDYGGIGSPLSKEIKDSLINVFGEIIIGIRKGNAFTVVMGEKQKT